MPMDAVFDTTREIAAEQLLLKSTANLAELQRHEIQEHIVDLRARREGSYEFVRETAEGLKDLISSLEPIAQQSFEKHALAVRGNTVRVAAAAP